MVWFVLQVLQRFRGSSGGRGCQVGDRSEGETEDSAAGVRGTFQFCLVNSYWQDWVWSGSQLGSASSRGEVAHTCGVEM